MFKKSENAGIKIDKEILIFLSKAEKHAGSLRKLAAQCDVSAVSVSRWFGNVADQKVDCIDWPSWEKLWIFFVKHSIVSADDPRWMPPVAMREALVSGKFKPTPNSEVSRDIPKPPRKVPIVSTAAAAEVNTSYFPLAEYADQYAEETAYFPAAIEGDFVIRVQGESMKPWYPPGTLLLVRPHQHIRNGDRVVAVLGTGDVLFKCFVERKKTIMLLSINGSEGKNLEFQKTDFSAIRDLYKVIQTLKTEEILDDAMKENGVQHFWQKFTYKICFFLCNLSRLCHFCAI